MFNGSFIAIEGDLFDGFSQFLGEAFAIELEELNELFLAEGAYYQFELLFLVHLTNIIYLS